MSEDRTTKAEVIARSLEKVSDSKGLEAIGHGLGWGIAAMAIAAVFLALALSPAALKWDGHLHPQTKCYEVKEIAGELVKFNTCTGEAEKISIKAEASAK
ncbi:hypothetical protein OU997_16505 [Pseudomonas sp. SL4(2022)]|uniref:hypothetical protein n=1 Tax=Pseudomonas sp. SL4(2022) TaxID=2994661 RepID=UPI00226FAD17|nr:hypothetical protein [Pseudomonas sp. SL4(2022)]WAC43836.1 hypothetical protein OU997_16505 [Pseudomonas sp. SL4(2022)]